MNFSFDSSRNLFGTFLQEFSRKFSFRYLPKNSARHSSCDIYRRVAAWTSSEILSDMGAVFFQRICAGVSEISQPRAENLANKDNNNNNFSRIYSKYSLKKKIFQNIFSAIILGILSDISKVIPSETSRKI